MKNTKAINRLLPVIMVAIIIIAWWIESLVINEQLILPSPKETFLSFIGLFKDGKFYIAVLNTLLRSLIAFAVSFFVALMLALAARAYPMFAAVISPVISILRALPTIAVVLLLLLWVGKSVAPVIVTMLVVLPLLFSDISETLGGIDREITEMCNLYRVSAKERILKVDIPMIMPSLLINAGTGISLNIKLMVAAEVLASTPRAVGYLMDSARYNIETAELLALMIVVIILGVLIENLFRFVSSKVCKWK